MKVIKLIILGAGKSTLEIIDIINDINNKSSKKIEIVGILADDKKLKNKKIYNTPVLGPIKDIKKFKKEKFFLGIFSYQNRFVRAKIISSFKNIYHRFINIVHPSALISSKSKIGYGCLVSNNVNIHYGSKIGNFCIMSPNSSIAPLANIKSNCFIGNAVVASCKSKIDKNTYFGFHSSLLENVKIAEGSRVLPNTIVNKTIKKKNGIIFGSPARIIAYDK